MDDGRIVLPVAIGLLARLVGLGWWGGSDAPGATKAPSAAGAAVSPASGGTNCSVVGRSWSYKGPLRGWRRGVPRERGNEL
jgi:hypothetical protein